MGGLARIVRPPVRLYRGFSDGASGRILYGAASDDLSSTDWGAMSTLTSASRSPPSAAYASLYNEFWTLFTE